MGAKEKTERDEETMMMKKMSCSRQIPRRLK